MPPKDNSDREAVRRRLMLVREWKGMNQTEFCRATEIRQNLLSMIENDKRPPSHLVMRKIKAAFSIPFDWLYDGDITEQIPHGLLKHVMTKARMD